MVAGVSNKMQSKFYLRFSMILSILRSQDLTIEDVLKRSFAEINSQKQFDDNDYEIV